jgi:GxxExxY protein
MRKLTKKYVNDLSYQIIGAAIKVHKALGSGLLEKVYQACMEQELHQRQLNVKCQQSVPIIYEGIKTDALLRFDLLVDDCIIIELKAVEKLNPIFEAQIMSYMHFLQVPKGIIINFCCRNIFKEGQKTFVNEIFRDLPDE